MATSNCRITKKPAYPGLGIDFITLEYDENGSLLAENGLDVPAESFTAGDLRGQRAAFQLMAAAEMLPKDQWDGWFETVLHSAVQAATEQGDCNRRGAAVGMLYILDHMLVAFARTGLWRTVLDEQMALYRRGCVEEHQELMATLDEFVASIKECRGLDAKKGGCAVSRTSAKRAVNASPAIAE